jgi:hypothetical protein
MKNELTDQEQKEQDKLGHEQIVSYLRWLRYEGN